MKRISTPIFVILLAWSPLLVQAQSSFGQNQLRDIQRNLSILQRKCQKLPSVTVVPSCREDLAAITHTAQLECRHMHRLFSESLQQTSSLIKRSILWMRQKGVVRDNGQSITILMSPTSDPSFPLLKGSDVVNKALQGSSNSLDSIGYLISSAQKKSECKTREATRILENFEQFLWSDPKEESLSHLHNKIGTGISRFSFNAFKVIESGGSQRAFEALEQISPGLAPRRVR